MEASLEPEHFELKAITKDGLEAAVDMAERYRLLQQPAQSRSICLDVLAVEPDNQRAIVTLILAITDKFGQNSSLGSPRVAREYLEGLNDEHERAYYTGIIAEREARGFLERGPAQGFAYDGFRDAMEWYERAAAIRPEGNDLAILRWNACVRTIEDRKLKPRKEERELGLE